MSRLSDSLVDPRLGVSVMSPADRNACTWWVIVGLDTFRLLARSADVVGVRASIDAIAYRVVSPSARNTDSALISLFARMDAGADYGMGHHAATEEDSAQPARQSANPCRFCSPAQFRMAIEETG